MNMPILQSLAKRYRKDEDVVVLHINHCMDNSFYFCEQLKCLFHEVVFIGVPYNNKEMPANTDYPCYYALNKGNKYLFKRNGQDIYIKSHTFMGAVYELLELAIFNEITEFARQGKKIIIIEDGGYHHDLIASILKRNKVLNGAILGAVEQTTAGTRKSHANGKYPVLSVARSIYKTRIEAYFVANTVLRDICRFLNSIDIFIDFRHVYIMGYGIIGRPLAKLLAMRGAIVHVCDTDNEILCIAKNDGFIVHSVHDVEFLDGAIVLGCAGEPSFTIQMLEGFLTKQTSKIYLASASSKQIEFSDVLEVLKTNERWRERFCAGSVFPNGKEVVLIADGYPVNFFDEESVSLTYSMIDIVFAEMTLLALFLKEKQGASLKNKTYLLSVSPPVDLFVNEDKLIAEWKLIHKLSISEGFNIHPMENKLKHNSTGFKAPIDLN